MKFSTSISITALFGCAVLATSFTNFGKSKKAAAATKVPTFSVDSIPGALAPVGLFDPLGFAAKADEMTLRRYREAELTHSRVAIFGW